MIISKSTVNLRARIFEREAGLLIYLYVVALETLKFVIKARTPSAGTTVPTHQLDTTFSRSSGPAAAHDAHTPTAAILACFFPKMKNFRG
jgi:hypothetical protein